MGDSYITGLSLPKNSPACPRSRRPEGDFGQSHFNPNLLGRGSNGRYLWRYRIRPTGAGFVVIDSLSGARVAGPFNRVQHADLWRDRWNGIGEDE